MTLDQVLSDVIRREGGFVDDALDRGGATNMGITAATLGLARQLNRPATVKEVQALTEAEARAIYLDRYVRAPGFDTLPEWLIPIVVDDAVLSGPHSAITTLQQVLGVPADGMLGAKTKQAAAAMESTDVIRDVVKARALRYARIVQMNPSQGRFLVGWLTRALSFL